MKKIKERNILSMAILTIVTLGFYTLYWIVQTKNEIKDLGADIPSVWLLILPLGNIYFLYKYADGFVRYVKNGENTLSYFFILLLPFLLSVILPIKSISEITNIRDFFIVYLPFLEIEFISMIIIQLELNKLANKSIAK